MFAARSAATKGPRGSKNSPFVGRYETLDDSNPILYSRVLVPPAGNATGTEEKKKRSIEEVDAVPASEEAEDKDPPKELKKKKKKSKTVEEDVEEPQASEDEEEEPKTKKKSKKEKKHAVEEPAEEENEKKIKKSKKKKDADASDEDADDSPGTVQDDVKAADSSAEVKEKRKKKKDRESADSPEGKSAAADGSNAGGKSETSASEGKKRKKPRSEKGVMRQKQRAEARAERVAAGEDVEPKEDGDSKDEPSAPTAERLIKGANTLQEEAQVMRERLGLVSSAPADSAAAESGLEGAKAEDPAPATSGAPEAAEAKQPGGFSFGFTVNAKVEQEMEDRVARLTGMVRNEEGQVVSASQPETDGRRVYVGGMPFSYDEASIKEYWEYCGELDDIDMMTFQDSGNFRGIVFLTFKTTEAAAAALQYDGEDCDGKTLKVMPAHSRGKKGAGANKPARPQGPAQKTPGYNVLYVGNLAYEATEEEIKEHFKGCTVTKVRIHTDKDTGRPKGYAHVHVEDDASMDAAAEYDQSELQGRPIKVMFAQPKKE